MIFSKFYYFLILIAFFPNILFSQEQQTISGICKSIEEEKISNANVIVKDVSSNAILCYTSTNEEGYFLAKFKSTQAEILLSISFLGYRTFEKKVNLPIINSNLGTLILEKDTNELKEIIIESEKKAITIKGDTTVYNVKKFLNGTEDNLKDLIKNLPGIRINSNGKIEVNGKVISELLIDGENLYKSQHQLATENLSSKIVESIEYYKNHVPFDKIKSDSISDQTALNVIIKEEYKKKFKGHIASENNFSKRYKVNSTIYNLHKKNKISFIQNHNNLGELPISIIDYFSLIDNEEIEENSGSKVNFKSFNSIPEFLKSGENVAKKNNAFFNLSNIYIPNKTIKIQFYSILNTSSQNEILSNSQRFTASDLKILENITTSENNFFGIFDLKSIFKPNANTILKMNNSILIDDLEKQNKIESTINEDISFVNQQNNGKSIKIENSINFSKKLKKNSFNNNTFFIFAKEKNNGSIVSTNQFLNLDFSNDYIFNQIFNKTKTKLGSVSKYEIKSKKLNTTLKISYIKAINDFNNNSSTHANYINQYKSNEDFITQEINTTYNFTKKISFSFSVNNNSTFQTISEFETYRKNFIGYNFSTKIAFNPNSILQINKNYSNTLSSPDNIIENEFIKDYRTIIKNLNLQPNSLFPLNKINLGYLNTNPETNSFLIINLNHSWSNKSEGVNIINSSNYNYFENAITPKNEFSDFIIFYEKNLTKIPFAFSANLDLKYKFNKFLTNNNLSFFKSTYISNAFNFRSKFKKSPIHFDLGILYSVTNYYNNESKSNNKVIQFLANTKGIVLKNIYWKANYSYNNFIVNNNKNLFPILSFGIRYSKQKTNWDYTINAHNILNFKNPLFVTNESSIGYESQISNQNLPGYIAFGIKYKF
jgi:hypothetical protein